MIFLFCFFAVCREFFCIIGTFMLLLCMPGTAPITLLTLYMAWLFHPSSLPPLCGFLSHFLIMWHFYYKTMHGFIVHATPKLGIIIHHFGAISIYTSCLIGMVVTRLPLHFLLCEGYLVLLFCFSWCLLVPLSLGKPEEGDGSKAVATPNDEKWEKEARAGPGIKLRELLKQQADVENAIEQINMDWRERMDAKRVAKTEQDIRQMERRRENQQQLQKEEVDNGQKQPQAELEQLGQGMTMRRPMDREVPQFDPAKFRAEVEEEKPCDKQPLQIAEYFFFKHSDKVGIYHVGLLVCGIEVHFHRPGIEFWKPMEYSTRYVGGMHRDYQPIYHNGHPLYTHKSFKQIVAVTKQLEQYFNPSTYNLLTRNCLLFLRTFVRQLTGLVNDKQIDWPWSAIHPLKKPNFALKKLKSLVLTRVGSSSNIGAAGPAKDNGKEEETKKTLNDG